MKKILPLFLALIVILISCTPKKYEVDNTLEIFINQELQLPGTNLIMIVQEVGEVEELKPDNPSGYYDYYSKQDGYHYFVITGILKNQNSSQVKFDNFYTRAFSKFLITEKEVESKFIIQNGARTSFFEEMTVTSEIKFHIITIVEDGKENPNRFEIYYNNDLLVNDNLQEWDNLINFKV